MSLHRYHLVVLGLLSGCATIYEGRYDYDQGWRAATVERIVSDVADLGDASRQCPAGPGAAHYAYVRYTEGMRPRHTIVAVPDRLDLQVGQRIYINNVRCGQELAVSNESRNIRPRP